MAAGPAGGNSKLHEEIRQHALYVTTNYCPAFNNCELKSRLIAIAAKLPVGPQWKYLPWFAYASSSYNYRVPAINLAQGLVSEVRVQTWLDHGNIVQPATDTV